LLFLEKFHFGCLQTKKKECWVPWFEKWQVVFNSRESQAKKKLPPSTLHSPKKEEHKIKKYHDKSLPPLQVPKGTNQFCTQKPYCGMLRFPIFAQ
jgi:hypothetical protein